ncbi:LpqB family beta-propeller domain-containing protein [Cellulomonas sp. URHD0024]|uniref:LpqB family beta-propeller domain-containing protein n=1 Tax=Cellulomonas sp. URHD0024 TaxID=1302620 RepID=UPI00041C973A|nr:LpqB family beta-propeller domain-containing protein [Cellulomonas sp. URHD0024]
MRSHRVRRAQGGGLAGLVLLLASACAAIPMSGPPQKSEIKISTPADIQVLAAGPAEDATPQEIVDGFLAASAAGFSDDFDTAREYLAGAAKVKWQPLSGQVVAGPIAWAPSASVAEVVGDVPVSARVDGDGQYVEAPPNAVESVTFDLVQDDSDQWRISGLPDGLILRDQDFERTFQSTPIYFLSPDKTFLVPDTRWLPKKNLQTAVVQELLQGPSPWLSDAVTSAIPEGAQLDAESVLLNRDDGVAHVGLSPLLAVTRADTPLLLAQINESLRLVPGVGSVEVTAVPAGGNAATDGVPLVGDPAKLDHGTAPAGNVEFLQADRLVSLSRSEVVPVGGVGTLEGLDARSPAVSADGSLRVLLSGPNTLVTAPTPETPAHALFTGGSLAAPSIDRLGWTWTASSNDGIVAVKAGSPTVSVLADWLTGRIVRAVRVSPDGTRLAVISSGADGVAIQVSGIIRDESGAPQQIGDGVRAGASMVDATSVVWIDESTLGVLGRSTGNIAVHLVPVSGPTQSLPEVADPTGMAGGIVIYVTTLDGSLRRYVDTTWAPVAGVTGASYPSYPG